MPKYTRQRLTKTLIDTATPGAADQTLWDADVPGLGLRVRTSGAKSWIYRYAAKGGRWRQVTLGTYGPALLLKAAQDRAKTIAADVRAGADPLAAKAQSRAALTVNELLDAYLQSEAFAANAESTRAIDKGVIDNHIRPTLGRLVASEVTAEDVMRMRRKVEAGGTARKATADKPRGRRVVKGGEGIAGKALGKLAVAYRWAISQRIDPSITANPADGLKGYVSNRREIPADPAKHSAIFAAIDDLEVHRQIPSPAAAALRLVAWTGLRRGEAQKLCWRQVDLARRELTFMRHEHKAGHRTQRPKVIALPQPAVTILAALEKGDPDARVFPPETGDQIRLNGPWNKVRAAAGLPGLPLHGLRHMLGSALATSGLGVAAIAGQLGHAQIRTAEIYIGLAAAAKQDTASRIEAAITGKGVEQ